jgi:DNA repair protein RadD
MSFQDRQYQIEAVGSIWSYFKRETGNPVLALPTGTGKSIVIARFLQSVFNNYPNQRVMMLTHVKELIQQNYEKLMAVWPFAPCGIYSAGLNKREHHKAITFAGIASVAKRWAMFGHVDLIIIDEAHLVSPSDATMYQTFIQGLRSINPWIKVIGLTATPWRLGHGHITDPVVKPNGEEEPSIFTDVCFDITGVEAFNRLIAEGFLTPLVPKRTRTVLDVDGVHMRGGEFIEKELQLAVDKDEVTYAALKEAMEIGHDRRKWLIFAAGTEHADHIADMLNTLGIPTGCVHSKREGRDQTIQDFKRGKLRAVVNNNVLTTGFDDPEIDMIIVLRPTASSVLWVQMLGRGTRPLFAPGYDLDDTGQRLAAIEAGGKRNCLVLDYAQNTKRLGPINDPVVPRRKGQKGGEAPVKCCPACDTWVHASLRFCGTIKDDGTVCQHEFKFEHKLNVQAGSNELIKGDLPVVNVFKVDHITMERHEKLGRPPMIRISYFCGYKKFDEFFCPEHTDWAGKKARRWWKERSSDPMPTTVADALEVIGTLRHATHLRVWVNKKWPEILATCFDGSAFGDQESSEGGAPTVQVTPTVDLSALGTGSPAARVWDDDDIPF